MKPVRLVAPAAIALTLASAAAQDNQLILGVAGPMTGASASSGLDMLAGVEAAVEQANRSGGVLGRTVKTISTDDECKPGKAVSAANHLVGRGVKYVIGHYCSDSTVPASETYAENGMLQVTLSQGMKVTQQNYPRLFRSTPNADALSASYVDTVITEKDKGNNRIAILSANSDYGRSLSDGLIKSLAGKDIQAAYVDHYNPDDGDFGALITKMKSRNINLLLLSGGEQQMGKFIRQASETAFRPAYVVSSTALSADFASVSGGCNVLGVKTVAALNPLSGPSPDLEPLRRILREKGANSLDTAFNSYLAARLVLDGIVVSKSTDPAIVADYLHRNPLPTPIGQIEFTASGEQVHPKVITYEFQADSIPCRTVYPRPVTP